MSYNNNQPPLLELSGVYKTFKSGSGKKEAVSNVSLYIGENESVGLIGESGCGKSTLAKLITKLEVTDAGSINLCGVEMTKAKGKKLRQAYGNVKMIFQEPRSSFDPYFTLGSSIIETIKAAGKISREEYRDEAIRLLECVGLDASYENAYPRSVSGGECQRAAIARAIAANPRLLICDEATSALDVSIQAQILELLSKLRGEFGMSIFFISHDLVLVSSFCERTYVMCDSKIVEHGKTTDIINDPKQDYTKNLLASIL